MESSLLKKAWNLAAKAEGLKEETPSPVKSESSKTQGTGKRTCTSFEKFVKKQSGDVSILKEPLIHSWHVVETFGYLISLGILMSLMVSCISYAGYIDFLIFLMPEIHKSKTVFHLL